jgi:lactate permease
MPQFFQTYDPLGNPWLSTLVAGLPIFVLLYFLAIHPHRDSAGRRHLGIEAPKAGALGALTAILVAMFLVGMPWMYAVSAWFNGAAFGMLGIGWIVVAAMFLYTMTLITGRFEIVKESITGLSADRRIQAILIAFSFGAFIEGAAGFGTPVAIAGAMMVGLGFSPISSAVLCLIANTAPVAFGALGTPIVTLAAVTDLPKDALSAMAGRQLPPFSLLIPLWLTAAMVFMNKGKWRDVTEVWPAILVAGGSFAATQFYVSNYIGPELTDILGGIISMASLAGLMLVWKPKRSFLLEGDTPVHKTGERVAKHSTRETVQAWIPWAILTLVVFFWGLPPVKAALNKVTISFPWPYVHGLVFRTPPVVPKVELERAMFNFNWLAAPGTGVLVAALATGLFLGLSKDQWIHAVRRTAQRMKVPLLTIGLVLGLGYVTRYSGTDAILGLAFTKTGVLYPFFAAVLGWLGVFLTGSDTSSNALFGSLQKITAQQLNLDPVLITAANSTGGVMGKMIDAQSIVVATAACYEDRTEGANAVGPIFRKVVWHSIALVILMGLLILAQAGPLSWMIPEYTLK